MSIYVGGPVVRPKTKESSGGLSDFYDLLANTAKLKGIQIELPYTAPEFEKLVPREFFREIAVRIRNATAVISVLPEGDQSVPVEAAVASNFKLPTLLVGLDREQAIPRVIAGLPSVTDIIHSLNTQKYDPSAIAQIESFISKYGK